MVRHVRSVTAGSSGVNSEDLGNSKSIRRMSDSKALFGLL
jgi:hypothetical protein